MPGGQRARRIDDDGIFGVDLYGDGQGFEPALRGHALWQARMAGHE